MTRVAYTNRDNQDVTYSQLAIAGINNFLDYLANHKSMEFVSLVSQINIFNNTLKLKENSRKLLNLLNKIAQ